MSTTDKSSSKSLNGVLEENSGIQNGISVQAASETQVSPRVSTVGTDEPGHKKDSHHAFAPQEGNAYRDYTDQDPSLDSLHWAGVQKRGDFDQRSVASSMNAEKDDKSIYEEPAVGAVEEAEEDLDEDEEPEEIVLSGMGMGEPSSSTIDIRGGDDSGEHTNHEDSYAHENASPREMETRIAASSVAVSDADAASIRPLASEDGDGDLEDISLDKHNSNSNHLTSDSIPMPPRGGSATTGGGGESIVMGSSAAPSSAASPRSLGLPPSPLSRASGDFENHLHHESRSPAAVRNVGANAWGSTATAGNAGSGEQYKSSLMRKVTGTDGDAHDGGGGGSAGIADSVVSDVNTEDLDASASMVATDGASGAPSLTGSVPRTITAEIVAEEEEEERVEQEDKKEEEEVEVEKQLAAAKLDDENKHVEMPEGTGVPMESFEVENNTSGLAPAAGAAAAGAAAAATITAAASGSSSAPSAPKVNLGPEWEDTFKGLLYSDGVDALGRPVVVLNADAVPPRMKASALTYVKAHLEPLVNSGHYVIVFTARKAKLPSFWIMGAYQTLPRPYRKNVQFVILVKPSGFLKAILAFMKPFVSKKAGRKIKAVDSLEEIGESTGGEVTVHHLGEKFLNDDAIVAEAAAAAVEGP